MKKKQILSLLLSLLVAGNILAQEEGTITPKMLARFNKTYQLTPKNRAASNAMLHNEINKLVGNMENQGEGDTYFSHRVKTKGITDQESSGRCWLFASLNVMRPKVIEKYNLKNFEFSQNYNYFFDQLEKANLFLEGIIESRKDPLNDRRVEWLLKNVINDGGVWNGYVNMAKKYGVVPSEVMPETYTSNHTRTLNKLIRRKLREDALQIRDMAERGEGLKPIRKAKEQMLQEIYNMLALTLGEPPTQFTWRYRDADDNISEAKSYTPLSFYEEFVGVDLDDYVMLMNDPTRPYNTLYEIDYDRNALEGINWVFINLPNEKIKDFAIKSIKDNEAMYFSCDVGKQLDREEGSLDVHNFDYESLMGVSFGMDKKERILTFESGSSHGMTLVAVDLNQEGKPTKWLLENSWGASNGFEGHLIMTDEWFDEYMFRVVINKKYIDPEILKILKTSPVLLPPWDPMFNPAH
ncbi:MAG: aminopeptidase [Bacteroidetes bacterium]|nr:MAG: aminopeptidase [Bacteroidota bacterium]PIE88383.1 MAG: aminopeptidase [Bacteroidota bacterium]